MRIKKNLLLLISLVISFSFCGQLFAQQDSVVLEAQTLIKKGDFKAAYTILEPLEDARAGDIDFDYLLGIAGVESNNVTRGAFALERVLALDPNHKDARAEMAKAHLLLGEEEAAKAEFKNVLALNPDIETKKTIEKLLTAIDKIEGTVTTFGAFLDFGLGYDTNVSSAPLARSVTIAAGVPNFGGLVIPLDDASRAQSDHFYAMAGGVSFRHPITKILSAFGSVSGTNRINIDKTAFDNSSLDFNAGLQLRMDKNSLSVALQDNHFDLNGESFRHAYGASAQWLYDINAYNQAGVYAQYSRLNYNGGSNRNAERSIVGFNVGHVFQGDYNPIIFASIYGGREDARDVLSDFLSQDIIGFRTGGQISVSSKWQAYLSLGVEDRNHDAKDNIFLTVRNDKQYDFTVGARFSPMRDWSIKPQFSYTRNDSNTVLNDFDRQVFSINIRKDFSW